MEYTEETMIPGKIYVHKARDSKDTTFIRRKYKGDYATSDRFDWYIYTKDNGLTGFSTDHHDWPRHSQAYDIKEASPEEAAWFEMCEFERKFIPKPKEVDYGIF